MQNDNVQKPFDLKALAVANIDKSTAQGISTKVPSIKDLQNQIHSVIQPMALYTIEDKEADETGVDIEVAKYAFSKPLGSKLNAYSNYMTQVSVSEQDPQMSPLGNIKKKKKGEKNKEESDSEDKKNKKGKFQTFLDGTGKYIGRIKGKTHTEPIKKMGSINTKSLNDLEESGTEVSETDKKKMVQFSLNNIGRGSVEFSFRGNSVNLDTIPEKNSAALESERSIEVNTYRPLKLPENYLNEKKIDDIIVEIEAEGEQTFRNKKQESAPQTVNSTKRNVFQKTVVDFTNAVQQTKANKIKLFKRAPLGGFADHSRDFLLKFAQRGIVLAGIMVVLYFIFPIVIALGAYAYSDKILRTVLSFALLGLLHALVQLILLNSTVDSAIKKRILDIEGNKQDSLETSKYFTVRKLETISMFFLYIGLHIAGGFCFESTENLHFGIILVESLCITILTNIVIFLIIWARSPSFQKNSIRMLSRDLQQISKVRKNFLSNLENTRKFLKHKANFEWAQRTQSNIIITSPIQTLMKMTTTENLVTQENTSRQTGSPSKLDIRSLEAKEFNFAKEIRRIRLGSIMTLSVLVLTIIQMLIVSEIGNRIVEIEDSGSKVVLVGVIEFISILFGIVDIRSWKKSYYLSTVKIANILVTVAVYRSLFLGFVSLDEMIGAIAIKYVIRVLDFAGSWLYRQLVSRCLLKKSAREKKDAQKDFLASQGESDHKKQQYSKYLIQKVISMQGADMFFILTAFSMMALNQFWQSNTENDFSAYINNKHFYPWVLLVELAIIILFGAILLLLCRTKVKSNKLNMYKEAWNSIANKKWMILAFKAIILFFIFIMKPRGYLTIN